MARGRQGRDGGRRRLAAGAALVALGAVVLLVTANVLVIEGIDGPRDARSVSTSLIAGLAVLAYGIILVVEGVGGPRDARPDVATTPHPGPVPPVTARDLGRTSLDGLLTRSDDLVPTLRDLVAHGRDEHDYGDLPALLGGVGIASWETLPRVQAGRLRRNGRWWLTCDEDAVSEDERERLLALEAALNVTEDLAEGPWRRDDPLAGRVARVFSRVADLPLALEGRGQATGAGVTGAGAADVAIESLGDERGEWRCRARFSCLCENAAAPFRITLAFQANLRAGLLCADVIVPRPRCLGVALVPEGGLGQAARDYALRAGLLVGRAALASSPQVTRAVINCLPAPDEAAVLSLDLSRDAIARLRSLARGEDPLGRALAGGDPAVRARVSPDGWLLPVEPLVARGDELVGPASRFRPVELDGRPCGEALARTCGAQRVRDLGIMEKMGRLEAWEGLAGRLGESTQGAVSLLVATRDATDDVTVAEACDRVVKALVEGTADVSDTEALGRLFVDGGRLALVAARLRAVIGGDASPSELERALAEADGALSPIAQTGIYLDDGDSVFRYFNSAPERVLYNLSGDAGARRVRLVPDEYYAVLTGVMQVLTMLGRAEEALARGEELLRVAPVTPDATLSVVRCLEESSRPFEAIDLLRRAIGLAPTARDLAVCLYRLAYMEWRVGRGQLAVACYQQAIALRTDVTAQAQRELEELLATDESLSALSEDEAARVLEAAGIPRPPVGERERALLEAAAATADAGLFPIARALCGAAVEFDRDDALVDVYRSLMRQ